MSVKQVRITEIDPNPWQPRLSENADHIANLAVSIADDGMMQIPSGRQVGQRVQLAFGHSRFAAYRLLDGVQAKLSAHERIEFADDSAMARVVVAADKALENGVDFLHMPINLVELDDEQMYRYAVSENIQRRDLSPIETARAMARYRDEFGKKSADIGTLFGLNESTVRGTLRMLELPADCQDLLSRGEISQGAARALLSMARILPASKVSSAALEMSTGKRDATEIARERMRYNNETISMDTVNEGERPRGGREGWLLDMKNFPSWRIRPVRSKDELRNAFQLAPMQAQMLDNANGCEDFAKALDASGQEVNIDLAQRVRLFVFDMPMGGACTACPRYTSVGREHFCGVRPCFERRMEAWRAERISQAAIALGIEMYDESDKEFEPLNEQNDDHKKLFREKHEDLRLIDTVRYKGYVHQYAWKGVNTSLFCVVMVGKTLASEKTKKKAERAKAKSGTVAVHNRADARHEACNRILWEAAGVIAWQLFSAINEAAIKALRGQNWRWGEHGPEWAIPKPGADESKLDAYHRREMALNMLSGAITHHASIYYQDPETIITWIIEAGKALGVEIPQTLVEMAQRERDAIDAQFPVSVETV